MKSLAHKETAGKDWRWPRGKNWPPGGARSRTLQISWEFPSSPRHRQFYSWRKLPAGRRGAVSPVEWELLPGCAPGSRKLSAHPPRPAACCPRGGRSPRGRGPRTWVTGARGREGGGSFVTTLSPHPSVKSSRSSPFSASASPAAALTPSLSPRRFADWQLPSPTPPGSTFLRLLPFFPWLCRGEQSSTLTELVSRGHSSDQNSGPSKVCISLPF